MLLWLQSPASILRMRLEVQARHWEGSLCFMVYSFSGFWGIFTVVGLFTPGCGGVSLRVSDSFLCGIRNVYFGQQCGCWLTGLVRSWRKMAYWQERFWQTNSGENVQTHRRAIWRMVVGIGLVKRRLGGSSSGGGFSGGGGSFGGGGSSGSW
jgi:uncharacterized protein